MAITEVFPWAETDQAQNVARKLFPWVQQRQPWDERPPSPIGPEATGQTSPDGFTPSTVRLERPSGNRAVAQPIGPDAAAPVASPSSPAMPQPAQAVPIGAGAPTPVQVPNPNDPKYNPPGRQGLKAGLEAVAIGAAGGIPAAQKWWSAPKTDAQAKLAQDVSYAKEQQGAQESAALIGERGAAAQRAAAEATKALNPPEQKAPTNDFELWQKQNPGVPVSEWLKLQNDVKNKPQKLTNPFEAFAYGSAQEKQAAQEFLTFEKKMQRQYEKPGEIEQRYSLYQRDPEAYKAMFGDRGAAQGETNAARMLNYFDKRRREITQDWTLDETTKAQQLADIDELAQPYLNAAGPGKGEDRVTVISPDGTQGTVPRSQLDAAKKKGYKLAQ